MPPHSPDLKGYEEIIVQGLVLEAETTLYPLADAGRRPRNGPMQTLSASPTNGPVKFSTRSGRAWDETDFGKSDARFRFIGSADRAWTSLPAAAFAPADRSPRSSAIFPPLPCSCPDQGTKPPLLFMQHIAVFSVRILPQSIGINGCFNIVLGVRLVRLALLFRGKQGKTGQNRWFRRHRSRRTAPKDEFQGDLRGLAIPALIFLLTRNRARPTVSAKASANLMRRALMRTSTAGLRSLSRIVPQVAAWGGRRTRG